jgi:hypothetical protein
MSTLKTNTLTGTTSAGSIVVTGEGGSTTTNLQQGLAKVWASVTVSAVSDSLNVSGLTDNGAGDFTFAYTNNMANQTYSTQHQPQETGARYLIAYIAGTSYITTSSLNIFYGYSSNTTGGLTKSDHDLANFEHHGDLA